MGKAEKGTPKYLANKMKAKGLQKLRWFCQMCEKQCRDENGFKCHISSESHQRQLLLFADNPHKYRDDFSKEFSDGYIELLRRRYGTKRVHANYIYQEYISDRNHLHMNATKWLSLTGFVTWLGREGKCNVDETEKGWYVTWIDRDPDTIARQQQLAKKQKMDRDDEERLLDFIEKQVDRAKDPEKVVEECNRFTELVRSSEDEKVSVPLLLSSKAPMKEGSVSAVSTACDVFKAPKYSPDIFGKHHKVSESGSVCSVKSGMSYKSIKRLSALEEIKHEQEEHKKRNFRRDNWLTEGIVVKVVTKKLGDNYFKEKGTVDQLIGKYVAIVKIHSTGHKLKLDQSHLETVIPSPGRSVKILNGEFYGAEATLKTVELDNFTVTIELTSGTYQGKLVTGLQYEDVSKIA